MPKDAGYSTKGLANKKGSQQMGRGYVDQWGRTIKVRPYFLSRTSSSACADSTAYSEFYVGADRPYDPPECYWLGSGFWISSSGKVFQHPAKAPNMRTCW
jgi:hypothetical protein